jgi:hypothetical protein
VQRPEAEKVLDYKPGDCVLVSWGNGQFHRAAVSAVVPARPCTARNAATEAQYKLIYKDGAACTIAIITLCTGDTTPIAKLRRTAEELRPLRWSATDLDSDDDEYAPRKAIFNETKKRKRN